MTKDGTPKWELLAWPPGPVSRKVDGKNVSTCLWRRDYGSKVSALRAVPWLHRRYPSARLEIVRYTWKGWCWLSGGIDASHRLEFCTCGGLLDTGTPDMWTCTRCGDEHSPEIVAAWPLS
jgi:hypothetical protein